MYDRGAWFLRVIMSSSGALLSLLSVKKQKHFSLLRVMNLSLRLRLITPASTLAILDMTKKNSSSDYLISLFRLLLLYVRVLVSGILAGTTPNVKAVLLTRVTAVCVLMDTRVRLVMKVTLFTRIGRFTTFKTYVKILRPLKHNGWTENQKKKLWRIFRCWRMWYRRAQLQCWCCV